MKKKVLILGGGLSKEREISLKSARAVFKSIKKKYNVEIFDPSKDIFHKILSFKPDVVFNALHGRFGEDGFIQTILESLKVKYTHSGVLASMKAMDKEVSKNIFLQNKILTPKFLKIKSQFNHTEFKKIKKKLKFPVVIKPLNEGSSLGVYICNKKNFLKNLRKLQDYKEVLVEQYIPGREIQAAILGNKKLGAIELKPKRKFYDYQAKYNSKANTSHIIPVNISKKNYNTLMTIALKAHKVIKCRGVTRSDFKFYKNKFYLLEINTQPGLTNLSLVPEIAQYNGMSFDTLIDWMIKDASKKR